MASIGMFIAGFITFPFMVIAVGAPFAYRAIKRGMDW